jgi:hypothetical protein
VRRRVGEIRVGFEVFGDDLVWRPAVQHTLAAGVASRVEATGTSLLILPLERSTTAAAGAAIQFLLLPFLHCEP